MFNDIFTVFMHKIAQNLNCMSTNTVSKVGNAQGYH